MCGWKACMPKRCDIDRPPRSLSGEEAEALFAKVDNSGHTNAKKAERQRIHRKQYGHGVDVDPLSAEDPSGSNVGKVITRASVILIIFLIGVIIFSIVYTDFALSKNTANLSSNVSVRTVADALAGGVDWGNGYTQFPPDFSVQEADQNTGRIEVTVIDTTSPNAIVCLSNSQIQAAALAVNSLLNPQIDTVIYHVNVHLDEDGNIQRTTNFGYNTPTGDVTPFMTFIWTKSTTADGQVRFNCTITGVDSELQETLRSQIVKETPPTEGDENNDETELDTLRR